MSKGRKTAPFHSTVLNFIMVLVSAFIVSSLVFLCMSAVSDTVITRYVRDNDLVKKDTARIVGSLQSFVSGKDISMRDVGRLADWARSEKYMHLIVFRQGEVAFDSDVLNERTVANGTIYVPNYSVTFRDQEAPIFLDSFYDYRFHEIAMFAELAIAFFLFTSIVVFFVAGHLAYIRQIVFGVEVLEGGNLEYEIPVRGNDELSLLAGSLNEVRKVFLRRGNRPQDASGPGIADLAVISHDLRTPLTTLILFIEIIKTKKNISDSERDYYIQKLSVIANKIKVLAENLEDFSSDDLQYPVSLEAPRPAADILREVLPEAVLFLGERGFSVREKYCLSDERIRVNNHFVYRIIDNVVSNIDRYADQDKPVTIEMRGKRGKVYLSFKNFAKTLPEQMKTSKLGLSLVSKMMHGMDGNCVVSKQANRFAVSLEFPPVDPTAPYADSAFKES